jgi:hypothetical protein
MPKSVGITSTREYRAWRNMMRRAYGRDDKEEPFDPDGTKVCPEWHKFERFFLDMGVARNDQSLIRQDDTKPFEPGNCRWGKRKVRLYKSYTVEFEGQQRSLADVARLTGIGYPTLRYRVQTGKPLLETGKRGRPRKPAATPTPVAAE